MGKKIIIVGSGIGGLAAGLLMAHAGYQVDIYEKNNIPGGRLSSYEKDGFKLDFGVHVISRGAKGPVGECLARAGIENAVQFTSVRPVVSFEGNTFRFPHDLKGMIPDEDFDGVMRFMQDCKSYTEKEIEELEGVTSKALLNRYTQNDMAHTCVSRIGSVYCALPSWTISAGEFIRCMTWEAAARASGYPEGGCIAITNAYLEGIKKYGGLLHLESPVEKILVENGRAVGILVGGQEKRADIVLTNAGIKTVVAELVGAEHFPKEYVERIASLEYSLGCPTLRIALDQPVTDIKMLSSFGQDGVRQSEYFDKLKKGIMPNSLNLFIVVPSNFSDTVAPKGKQLVSVAASMPVDVHPAILEGINDKIIDTLEQKGYIPDIRKHIMWTDFMSIDFMKNYAGEDGCIIGVGQSSTQMGENRPAIKSPLEGLYFASAEAGGNGVGIELAINSGMEFFDKYGRHI